MIAPESAELETHIRDGIIRLSGWEFQIKSDLLHVMLRMALLFRDKRNKLY